MTMDEMDQARKRISARKQAVAAAGDRDLSFEEQLALPQVGRWQHMHYACIEKADLEVVYPIDLTRLNTHEHLIAWFGHLQEKVWQPGTNFISIMKATAPNLPQ